MSVELAARREFRDFNLGSHDSVPQAYAIETRNFEETGWAMKKNPIGRVRIIRTPDNIQAARDAVIRSPHQSIRRHSASLQLHSVSLRRIC